VSRRRGSRATVPGMESERHDDRSRSDEPFDEPFDEPPPADGETRVGTDLLTIALLVFFVSLVLIVAALLLLPVLFPSVAR
jgi:hypothetical protein